MIGDRTGASHAAPVSLPSIGRIASKASTLPGRAGWRRITRLWMLDFSRSTFRTLFHYTEKQATSKKPQESSFSAGGFTDPALAGNSTARAVAVAPNLSALLWARRLNNRLTTRLHKPLAETRYFDKPSFFDTTTPLDGLTSEIPWRSMCNVEVLVVMSVGSSILGSACSVCSVR